MKKWYQLLIMISFFFISYDVFGYTPAPSILTAKLSKNKQFLFEMTPPPGAKGIMYKFVDGEKGEKLWSINGYHHLAELSNTGEHIVLDTLEFYRKNRMLNKYWYKDIIKNTDICDYGFGGYDCTKTYISLIKHGGVFKPDPIGFSADGLTYTYVTRDLTAHEFDVTTGNIKSSYFNLEAIIEYANSIQFFGHDGQPQSLGKLIEMGILSVPVLIKLLHDKNSEIRYLSAIALAVLKPQAKEAIPVLIDMLKNGSNKCLPVFCNVIGIIGEPAVNDLINLMNNKDELEEIREAAIIAMGYIGTSAKRAAPDLVKLLKANQFGPQAANTLRIIEEPSVSIILKAVGERKSDPDILFAAARALERVRPDTNQSVVEMINFFKDKSKDMKARMAVVRVLMTGWMAKLSSPHIIQILNDKDEKREVLDGIAEALCSYGPGEYFGTKEKEAIPVFLNILAKYGLHEQCYVAIHSLQSMGASAKEAVPYLLKLAKDYKAKDSRYAAMIAMALTSIDPDAAKEAISFIIKNELKRSAWLDTRVFETIGPHAKDAIPILIRLYNEIEDPNNRFLIGWALICTRPKTKKAIPILIEMLLYEKDYHNQDFRYQAALSLGLMGSGAKKAVPSILKALEKGYIGRRIANWALREIDVEFKHLEYLHIEGEFDSNKRIYNAKSFTVTPSTFKNYDTLENSSEDTDGDGITDDKDTFPYDPGEWEDLNNDGIGDNQQK